MKRSDPLECFWRLPVTEAHTREAVGALAEIGAVTSSAEPIPTDSDGWLDDARDAFDAYEVADAIGFDDRFGEQFLQSGVGCGGGILLP